MTEKHAYVGDSVYVRVDDDGNICITTDHHDHLKAGNVIFLEPSSYDALHSFVTAQRAERDGGSGE